MMTTQSTRDTSVALAIAVLRERLAGLSQDDQCYLRELVPALFSEDEEERQSAELAMIEILEQAAGRVIRDPMPVPDTTEPDLRKWMDFVGSRIREIRTAVGLTQEALAERSGVPQSHINQLENCIHSPTHLTLEKIASALGRPVTDFDPSAE